MAAQRPSTEGRAALWVVAALLVLATSLVAACFVLPVWWTSSKAPVSQIANPTAEQTPKRVLILSSFNYGYTWTDNMMQGIEETFAGSNLRIDASVRFMDMKRIPYSEAYFTSFKEMLRVGYAGLHFDAVLACDNDALNFMMKYRDELFPGVPVVFSSINDYSERMLDGRTDITGTSENTDYAGTIDVALRLWPQARTVIVLTDNTTTGQAHRSAVQKLELHFAGRAVFQYWNFSDYTMVEMGTKLAALRNDAVVLLLQHFMDKNQRSHTVQESTPYLTSRCSVPCFVATDIRLGLGAIGGDLVSGYYHGQASAEMVVRILKGEDVRTIPVMLESPNKYMFDGRVLERFGISDSRLPPGSVVLNRPVTIFTQYRTEVIAAALVLLSLAACVVVMAWEILRRKRAEASMREAHLQREALFEGARDAIFIADPSTGRIVQASRQAEALLGRPRSEIIGMHQSELHPADLRGRIGEAFQRHASGSGMPVEAEMLHRSGERIPVEIISSLVTMPDGSMLLQGIFRDTRERLRLEERLRQAEKMTAIGQLAGGVAHDFNNQLAAIMGYADLLADRLEEGDLKRHAQNIVVSAQRAADLTQQLLAFSRKGKYLSVPVAVHPLLGEVAMVLERSIDKRVRIVRLLKAGQAVVTGDPSQLQNAILNVALNARDAMPQGGELTFETDVTTLDEEYCRNNTYEIAAGPYLLISVTDTGCGMTSEVKAHLFEPFFTTKQPGKGTGMGLASVYGTVRNHHGAINVYSEVGRGTTVRIYLPLAPEAVAPTPANAALALASGTARILLVDDEAAVREMAAAVLRSLGYIVTTCADGREAVEYYRANADQVDLVILDMVMPEMGGRDTFLAMHRINPLVRALLSSGYSLNGEALGILNEGVLGFVGKPYRRAELSRSVTEALARK